ncbi:hypothetical protein R1sor_007834 [Riccia sorocarpa]|uniref:Uncharacterized protein n=1 Tax=Riccia sorocarpa TaxID=122646 RepID=A0ABD3HRW1_9MARC
MKQTPWQQSDTQTCKWLLKQTVDILFALRKNREPASRGFKTLKRAKEELQKALARIIGEDNVPMDWPADSPEEEDPPQPTEISDEEYPPQPKGETMLRDHEERNQERTEIDRQAEAETQRKLRNSCAEAARAYLPDRQHELIPESSSRDNHRDSSTRTQSRPLLICLRARPDSTLPRRNPLGNFRIESHDMECTHEQEHGT